MTIAASKIRRTSLNSDAQITWEVRPAGPVPEPWQPALSEPIAATVPGEIHTDLLAAGVIPDPFDGDNESKLSWIGQTNWTYRASFEWTPGTESTHMLVAGGLDTLATITLNGTEIAHTANQHRSYRFDITASLLPGSNDLVIDFEAPVPGANRRSAALGARPHANHHPYNAIRKMACNFGWDWGPDVAGVGIWQPLAIESYSQVRLAAVRPLATWADDHGQLDLQVDLEWLTDSSTASAELTAEIAGGTITESISVAHSSVALSISLDEVKAWWPAGHGEQNLYDLRVGLQCGEAADLWTGRVGFRTVSLSTAPDAIGNEFKIFVNGKEIYAKGANWIPDHAFVTTITAEDYRTALQEAVDAQMNLLRVWGGGLYESEHFYAACDELGLLVWQDFLFSCAAYAEEDPLRSEVEAEAREAITRLSQHASLAIWNGCNENIWGYVEWAWREPLAGQTWGEHYYLELLPRLVAELDPRAPYSPGSPFSYANWHHPNDERSGTMHIWTVWNLLDYSTYRNHQPRFVSEFGFQGPPAWSTLTSVVHDQPLDPYGQQMLVHQKAADGNLKLERGLGEHLPRWSNIDDWHWATQLNQARAIRFGIEHFRSLFPRNTGTVVWQLNDNWPVVSWAAVDSQGIRKPLWFALRDLYQDQLATIQPRDGVLNLFVHNDSDEPWAAELTVHRRRSVGDEVLARELITIEVDARSATAVALPEEITQPQDPTAEYIQVTGKLNTASYFVEDTTLQLAPMSEAAIIDVTRTAEGYQVAVTARSLIKDLALFPDRLDAKARVDSGLITLSAGESHTFQVTSGALEDVALTASPVLRSVNDLVG